VTEPSTPSEPNPAGEAVEEGSVASPRRRRRIIIAIAVFVLLGCVALTARAAIGVRSAAASTQEHLTSAKEALSRGDLPAAQAAVSSATTDVADARSAATMFPLSAVVHLPLLGAPLQDVNSLVDAADQTVQASGDLVTAYGSVTGKDGGAKLFEAGSVNLAVLPVLSERITSARSHLDAASAALDEVQADFPGTGALGQARDDAREAVVPVRATLAAVEEALPALPDAVGANGQRRYLLAILNSGELRSSGGAPLSVAMLTFDQGRLTISDQGQSSTEIFPGNPKISWLHVAGPPFARGTSLSRFVNSNAHPDFRVAGEDLMRAWAAGGKPQVDGVIALDVGAIASALGSVGPITTPGFGEVTIDNFADKWIQSYASFDSTGERQGFNDALAQALIERFVSGEQSLALLSGLAASAPGRHLQVNVRNPELQDLVTKVGLAGEVSSPTGDHAAWFSSNNNQSKTDAFSVRGLVVDARLAADGGAEVTQTLNVTNDTAEGFVSGRKIGYNTGWNRSNWFVYVPQGATDVQLAVPPAWAAPTTWPDGQGRQFMLTNGWLTLHQTTTMTLTYRLPAGTFDDGVYRLTVDPQPLVRDASVGVTLSRSGGPAEVVLPTTPLNRVIEVESAP